jgi:hypothetical protein
MKRKVVFGLIIFLVAAALALAKGCKEGSSVTLTYRVEIGMPVEGVFGGYKYECFYTNEEPDVDDAKRSVVVKDYYWGSCRAVDWKRGPFEGPKLKVVPIDGTLDVDPAGWTISSF